MLRTTYYNLEKKKEIQHNLAKSHYIQAIWHEFPHE